MSGVEIIVGDLQELERSEAVRGEQAGVVESMRSTVQSMLTTNRFMLMAINRCLDFTKTTSGLKLVPKYETIDLREALHWPIDCMAHVQQKIRILAAAVDEAVCSHVVTDGQWLQENLLCLLSNAVKYSSGRGNDVTIAVSLQAATSPLLRMAATPSGTSSPTAAVSPVVPPPSPSSVATNLSDSASPCSSKDRPPAAFSPCPRAVSTTSSVSSSSEPATPMAKESTKLPAALIPPALVVEEFLLFEVEDHGIGLSEAAMAALFHPFQQSQRLAGGTGLGLYSLAKRMEAIGGRYGVRKRKDGAQGSLFWFALPYRPDLMTAAAVKKTSSLDSHNGLASMAGISQASSSSSEPNSPPPTSSASEPEPRPSPSAGRTGFRVLITDDSPSILKMMTKLLQRQGHRMTTADNGQASLALISQDGQAESEAAAFDVVLMDLQMPVMDGLEATRRVRLFEAELAARTGIRRHQTIIGVSANSDHETMEEALKAGVDAFIAKPFTAETFLKTLRPLLEPAPQPQPDPLDQSDP
jgi:CheY-like chemotaxis protein